MTGIAFAASGYSAPGRPDFTAGIVTPDGAARVLIQARVGADPSCMCRGGSGELYLGCEMEHGAQIVVLDIRGAAVRRAGAFAVPGRGLCHIRWTGQGLVGCCYGSGDVFQTDGQGNLQWHWAPAAGHAHCSALLADGSVCWADLMADAVFFSSPKALARGAEPRRVLLPAGSGPRQLLRLDGERMLVVMENSGCVGLLCAAGESWELTSLLPSTALVGENYPGGCCFVPGVGAFVANRGRDTVALFSVEGRSLVPAGEWPVGGRWPRWTAFSGGLLACACQKSGEVVFLRWRDGALRPAGRMPMASPSCILLDRLAIGGSL